MELDLVLVLESKANCLLFSISKLTLCEPKITCCESDDRLTVFLCGCWLSPLTRFLDAGNESLGFSVSIEIDLAFIGVVDIDSISVLVIELDMISVEGSGLICFVHGVRK